VSKNTESDRRKSKDNDETIEEKTVTSNFEIFTKQSIVEMNVKSIRLQKTSIDSFKGPLRRKLRVFTKRKFNKESGKSSKRVSWSSDDNNEDIDRERLTLRKQKESQVTNE
jgi:hypothetical protein